MTHDEAQYIRRLQLRQWSFEQAVKTDSTGIAPLTYLFDTSNKILSYVNEDSDERVYFFTQDESSHWYMIPDQLRKRWDELTSIESEENCDLINEEFSDYRIGGGIGSITFKVVSKK